MSRRTEMLASTIQKELAGVIMRELADPRLPTIVSITRVKVSSDLSIADVYVTVMGTPGQQTAALNALKHSAGVMRTKLTKVLTLRVAPFLKFHLDEDLKKELAVLGLLDQVARGKAQIDRKRAQAARNPQDPPQGPPRRTGHSTTTAFMKNATKHAEELRSLMKRLLKEHKPEPKQPQDPLRALVRAAMSFDMPDAKADEAMRHIEREFVDLNELRVATDLEIQELLGTRYPAIEKRVEMITRSLNNIFEREHTLTLDRLKTVSKRDARQFLRELPEIHPFVEAYVMLFGFDGHAFPTDDETLDFLKGHGIVEDSTSLDECQRFVEHHLKAEECYDFFACLRAGGLDGGKKKKK